VETLSNPSKDASEKEKIKPVLQTPVKDNTPKKSLLSIRNIVLAVGGVIVIFIVLCILAAAIGGVNAGTQSGSNNGQSNNGQMGSSYQATTNNNNAEQAAYTDYNNDMQDVKTQADLMQSYTTPGNQPTNLADYPNFLSSFNSQIQIYDTSCNNAIASGKIYQQYLDPQSSEYTNITSDENTLTDSITELAQSYTQLENQYNTDLIVQNASDNYESSLRLLNYSYNDLQNYVNSTSSYTELTQDWLDGYQQRIDTYIQQGNDAINSGETYQQYLTPGTTEYNTVSSNEVIINNNINNYQEDYNTIESNYQSIQATGNLIKWLLPVL
jgi:chromosome segregation ATPase